MPADPVGMVQAPQLIRSSVKLRAVAATFEFGCQMRRRNSAPARGAPSQGFDGSKCREESVGNAPGERNHGCYTAFMVRVVNTRLMQAHTRKHKCPNVSPLEPKWLRIYIYI